MTWVCIVRSGECGSIVSGLKRPTGSGPTERQTRVEQSAVTTRGNDEHQARARTSNERGRARGSHAHMQVAYLLHRVAPSVVGCRRSALGWHSGRRSQPVVAHSARLVVVRAEQAQHTHHISHHMRTCLNMALVRGVKGWGTTDNSVGLHHHRRTTGARRARQAAEQSGTATNRLRRERSAERGKERGN